jgi:hypothetical protein
MKYFLLLIPMLFLFTNAWAEVFIQNDQQYIGDDGSLHIVGEIKNELTVPLNQIDVYVTLYSSDNKVVDELQTASLVNTIMPEMKAPFDFIITGNTAKMVSHYSLELDYKVTAPKNQVIDVTSSKLTRDDFNNVMITGTITNYGEITANTISVIATLYDKEGSVAAVSKMHTKPDYLRSDDKTFFLVSVPDKIQTSSVVDYSIVAESEEYAAAPEFPVGSGILLAGSVGAYLALTKYWKRSITNLVAASDLR